MDPPHFPSAARRVVAAPLLALVLAFVPLLAQAHVKWFAPYIVEAPPQKLAATLANPWFWTGIGLVLVFFLATRAIEKTRGGEAILHGFDKVTGPLWARGDDFMRFVIAAFFVAIFAVGGVYLTPDLKSPHEWVSWVQLVIAGLVFSRRTMPLAAVGIMGLWLLALTRYELFHLFDYLALGVGVAGYLVLASPLGERTRPFGLSLSKPLYDYRFVVLRWGVAIALMWSSLEKFAYPDWFYPLVEEKPFLTFGMPRDMFIPMAGVAEFTMGFGLLWTALIRRLSALALFVIFNMAVYPFGRLDLVGHALIMAVTVIIFANPTPQVRFALRRTLAAIPVTLVATLAVFAMSYWGLHHLLYGTDGTSGVAAVNNRSTHTHDPERPHEAPAAPGARGHAGHGAPPQQQQAPAHMGNVGAAQQAYLASMQRMHGDMEAGVKHPDPDHAFVRGMIAHHKAAVEMAQIQLQHGKDPHNRHLAEAIISAQKREIEEMEAWLRRNS